MDFHIFVLVSSKSLLLSTAVHQHLNFIFYGAWKEKHLEAFLSYSIFNILNSSLLKQSKLNCSFFYKCTKYGGMFEHKIDFNMLKLNSLIDNDFSPK